MELWQQCVDLLRDELPAQQFNTWIRPLQIEAEGDELRVYAPNRFVLDWVNEKYLSRLLELLSERSSGMPPSLCLLIGSKRSAAARAATPAAVLQTAPVVSAPPSPSSPAPAAINSEPSRASFDPLIHSHAQQPVRSERTVQVEGGLKHTSYLNRTFTFENFVEGKSNQLARAAAWQVADNPKHGYNPLF